MKKVDKAREERLAAALRANLRKRKAQARAVEESASTPEENATSGPKNGDEG